jgi:protein phosphatase
MLRVADYAEKSDTGRQRNANEDSHFARAPIFAVADGMGGAQAGEVASRIAADAFESGVDSGQAGEEQLARVAQEANREIHDLASRDSSRAGMGTTLTAAMVREDEVSLAHVGDSRAYRYRNGKLKQLTDDHSLVEELRRQGRLTDEQAHEHPQRSIITRALGPEPEVDIDTMTYPARHGDVFLLCSDGLTAMVDDGRIRDIIADAPSLEAGVGSLVDEANQMGGRDNITVVAFRLEEVGVPAPAEDKTLVGPQAEEAGITTETMRRVATRGRRAARHTYLAAKPKRRRARRIAKIMAAVLAVVGVCAAAFFGSRQIYFLGVDDSGRVAAYRGLPYELPLGIELYEERYASVIQASELPADRRATVTDHELRSHDDAESLVRDLERQEGVSQ